MPYVEISLSFFSALLWLVTLLLPWQPWRTREVLEGNTDSSLDLNDITVVIPARNEADVIANTLSALATQGNGLKIIVVDDHSDDATSEIAIQAGINNLELIQAAPLPRGWTGKLWAQEQGLNKVDTPYVLLLDADIELAPGTIQSAFNKLLRDDLKVVSLMAKLRFSTFWEKLLMPAFIYFFKIIYPFHLSNQSGSRVAAAAGGFILVETGVLKKIGGLAVIKDAIIDDCSLAKAIKSAGNRIWTGLTHAVISQRPYFNLKDIWEMVARTAFTQLNYSVVLLIICTLALILVYWVPVAGVFFFQGLAFWLSLFSLIAMVLAYRPTLKFYHLSPGWAFLMPFTAGLYLLMTWSSAIRYWKGERSRWKGRVYRNA
jgi:hopene-associated glycosyltransferase HpnB